MSITWGSCMTEGLTSFQPLSKSNIKSEIFLNPPTGRWVNKEWPPQLPFGAIWAGSAIFVFQVASQKSLPSHGTSHISHLYIKKRKNHHFQKCRLVWDMVQFPRGYEMFFLDFCFGGVGTTPHVQFLDEKDPWCQSS